MRVAILGSVALPVPPPFQGGTEWIAYHQAKGLAEKGHGILLFGSKGTQEHFKDLSVEVIEIGEGGVVAGSKLAEKQTGFVESSRKLRLENVYLSHVSQVLIDCKDDYDVILNNMRGEAIFLPIAKLLNKPFVNVMHLNLFPELADLFRQFKTHVITISNAQRANYPHLNYLATVYNGVEVSKFTFGKTPGEYLLMMGSIGRHKNQASAIRISKALNMKLVLAGKINDQSYFDEFKKDIDGEIIKWIGEIGFAEKLILYQQAKAFVFPINWEEPFGLVMIEAMSCGTPVVAFNRGAISEVVIDGKTGFVVENENQMIESVKKIDTIDRRECREHIEKNFTIEKMVIDYEQALFKVEPRIYS